MSLALLSTCVSVEEFFIRANWRGIEEQPTPLNQETDSSSSEQLQTASLTLNLEQFFALGNWRGDRQLTILSETELTSSAELSGTWSLTMTVNEFFQKMVWEGRPHIAVVPQPTSSEIKPTQQKQLNVTDLSDLF
jgi:hypothetical protein